MPIAAAHELVFRLTLSRCQGASLANLVKPPVLCPGKGVICPCAAKGSPICGIVEGMNDKTNCIVPNAFIVKASSFTL